MNTSRKRSRHDYSHSANTTPYIKSSASWSTSFSPSDVSPAPLANSRYELAGGLDTPVAAQHAAYDKFEESFSAHAGDFVRGRPHMQSASQYEPSTSEPLAGPLARERNGRARTQVNTIANNKGWRKAVVNTLTGAAGIVWDFCRTGASFRGFFAGDGQGYAMQTPARQKQHDGFAFENTWEDDDGSPQEERSPETPMPGNYPNVPYVKDYMDAPEAYSGRASKKSKHTYADTGDLSASWVMVNDSPSKRKVPATSTTSTASPASLRKSTARPATRRPTVAPAPIATARPASAAGLRSPLLSRQHTHSRTTSRDSVTSPRSARQSILRQPESPIAKETAKHIKEMKRKQQKEDEEMMQFNKRLQDMIREGKEALGSTIEIEMEDDGW